MVADAVDDLRPWQVGLHAVRFFIEKIPPAADGLRKRNRYRDQISSAHEALFVMLADKIADQEAENQATMDSQTAAADI